MKAGEKLKEKVDAVASLGDCNAIAELGKISTATAQKYIDSIKAEDGAKLEMKRELWLVFNRYYTKAFNEVKQFL